MTESRVFLLDLEDREKFLNVQELSYEELSEFVPDALTPEEINDIGTQIDTYVEGIAPSRWGYSNGLKGEKRVLGGLACYAVVAGDYITADNVARHFRKGYGIDGKIIAWTIGCIIRQSMRKGAETC